MTERGSEFVPIDSKTLDRLKDLHRSLMRLHKTLLDDERVAYERVYGAVTGAGRLLDLVMSDPWFDWLHRLSHLIVRVDEVTEDPDASLDQANELLEKTGSLLKSRGTDDEFMRRYKAVLQRNPGAVNDHVEVLRVVHLDRH